MKRITFFIITLLLLQNSFGQNPIRLLQSDSLYARGVELYHAEKYEEAIPMFEESISIDTKKR